MFNKDRIIELESIVIRLAARVEVIEETINKGRVFSKDLCEKLKLDYVKVPAVPERMEFKKLKRRK